MLCEGLKLPEVREDLKIQAAATKVRQLRTSCIMWLCLSLIMNRLKRNIGLLILMRILSWWEVLPNNLFIVFLLLDLARVHKDHSLAQGTEEKGKGKGNRFITTEVAWPVI